MRINKGNAVAQYAIIIVLVAIGLIPVFMATGTTISQFFSNFNNTMAENNDAIANNIAITPTTTSSSYTPPPPITTTGEPSPETPQLECSGSNCSINFGDYVLDGIPSDFTTYVSTAGSAGGTETLSAVLEDLAEEANISEEAKSLIKDLANRGYSVAAAQKSVQSIVESDVPSDAWTDGMYSYLKEDGSGPYTQFLEKKAALDSMLATASTQDQKNIKAIIDVLSDEIISMNDEFVDKCEAATQQAYYYSTYNTSYSTNPTLIKDIIDLESTGQKTDLDSAIICKTGNGESIDEQCN